MLGHPSGPPSEHPFNPFMGQFNTPPTPGSPTPTPPSPSASADIYRHPNDPDSRQNRDRPRGSGATGSQRPPQRPRRNRRPIPDDLGQMHTPSDIQSHLLYEALRASGSNVNNGEVIDALFPFQRPAQAPATANIYDESGQLADDDDLQYMPDAYMPDFMALVSFLLDTGSDLNVINDTTASHVGLNLNHLPWLPVTNAGGQTLATGPVSVKMKLKSGQEETLPFVVIKRTPNLVGWPAIHKLRMLDEVYTFAPISQPNPPQFSGPILNLLTRCAPTMPMRCACTLRFRQYRYLYTSEITDPTSASQVVLF